MLSGLLSKDKDDDRSEEDLYSLISSTTDLNISVNTDSCIDLRQPLVHSSSSSSESDISCKAMSRDESISPSITDLTNYQLTKHKNDLPSKSRFQPNNEYNPESSTVTEWSIHVNESDGSHQDNWRIPEDPKNVEIPEIPVTGYPPQECCTEFAPQSNINGSFQQGGHKPDNDSRFKEQDSKRNEHDTSQIFTDL